MISIARVSMRLLLICVACSESATAANLWQLGVLCYSLFSVLFHS